MSNNLKSWGMLNMSELTCPYCETEHIVEAEDVYDITNHYEKWREFRCEECDKIFDVEFDIEVTLYGSKKEKKEEHKVKEEGFLKDRYRSEAINKQK